MNDKPLSLNTCELKASVTASGWNDAGSPVCILLTRLANLFIFCAAMKLEFATVPAPVQGQVFCHLRFLIAKIKIESVRLERGKRAILLQLWFQVESGMRTLLLQIEALHL